MTAAHVWQEIRVLFAIATIFAALPAALAWRDGARHSLLLWTLRTVLFTEVFALLSGSLRLCLPGAMFSALVLFAAGAYLARGFDHSATWRTSAISILTAPWNLMLSPTRLFPRLVAVRRLPYGGFWIAAAVFVCFYPLQHVRFISAVSYSRVLSLDVLTLGQAWTPDGSVAFLAPVAFLSGEDAAAVIRFMNPCLIVALAATASLAMWELTRSRWGAWTVAASVFGTAVYARGGGELGSGGIAAIAWLLALVLLRRFSWDAAGAAALALMIEPAVHLETLLYLGGTLAGIVILWIGRSLSIRLVPAWGLLAAAPVIAFALLRIPAPSGEYQYESAATVAETISHTFPQRHWLIVSPAQELAFTYGHGWHFELTEFVATYSLDRVSRPDFKFNLPVKTVFVFVEKRPLGNASVRNAALFNRSFDPAIIRYERDLDRAGLEFAAGALVSAYATNHEGVDIFFEDNVLRVYKIEM